MTSTTYRTLTSIVADTVGVILRGAATGSMKYHVEAVDAMPHQGADAVDLVIRIRPVISERGS